VAGQQRHLTVCRRAVTDCSTYPAAVEVQDADVAAMGAWLERHRPLLLAGGFVVAQGGSWVLLKVRPNLSRARSSHKAALHSHRCVCVCVCCVCAAELPHGHAHASSADLPASSSSCPPAPELGVVGVVASPAAVCCSSQRCKPACGNRSSAGEPCIAGMRTQ
jgi:hypothetical protein